MNKRAMLLSVFLAFGSMVSLVPQASADHWRNGQRCDREDGRYGRTGGYDRTSGYGGYNYGNDRCSANAAARINKDRALIRQWEGTGRHEKVVRWAYADMNNVQRDIAKCRAQAQNDRYDPSYDRNVGYDPNYGRDPYYGSGRDPYYGNSNPDPYYDESRGFDFKRDWPLVLGTVLGAQVGR